MTLSLVFRIQAVMFAIFGFGMLLAPGAMMSSFMPDVGENAVAESIMQGMSLMVLAMSYISWQMPNWAADNIKTVGMFFAIVHVAWIVLTIFQMTSGAFPSDTANLVGNIGPDVVLAILFFWKSRADA
ncbi:uncharacterized protein METZ01_LOCUS340866 [marine metagenome]|jgi:hypothetical protein|uniref:DUF4345 domain-containing protein n=1 Tax=marine metagenome TaxID=408172 RepID=A0A382QT51_9ZZZZ